MECELLRSPMISYRSLLYNTTVLYDKRISFLDTCGEWVEINRNISIIIMVYALSSTYSITFYMYINNWQFKQNHSQLNFSGMENSKNISVNRTNQQAFNQKVTLNAVTHMESYPTPKIDKILGEVDHE